MALTAQDMSSMGRLAQLAANPQGVGRDEIYVAVASLYRAQSAYLTERERGLMRDILLKLSHDVEMAVRIALAERLADDEEAPVDLILMLCDDNIEVARPIILRSRKLTDANILKFLEQSSTAHQETVAQRRNIGEPVTDVLARSDVETVLLALVRNTTARIGAHAFQTLIEKSRGIEGLQSPLVHRQDLPTVLATKMTEWVSDALKSHIATNFKMDAATTEAAVEQAAHQVRAQPIADLSQGDSSQKLVEKLFTAGQLKAGFLLRVLHQGQIDLFDIAFARMLGIELNNFKRAFYQQGPRAVALACRAVGIDRAVFPTVFNLSRQARAGSPIISPEQRAEVENVFKVFTRADAVAIFKAQHAPSG
ncbi:MAG TPA: DUF2336 domain-containing protein [Rhizomicrobium sp.]|nr:DUF2336 domain-containing protein [Rhizomicrobium sp.]